MVERASSYYPRVIEAVRLGGEITLFTAVPVNAFNLISLVCCDRNLTTEEAVRQIYRGKVHNVPPSVGNFTTGLGRYLGKECPRIFIKVGVLTFAKPYFEQYFHDKNDAYQAFKTAALVAVLWGIGEGLINPLDMLRTVKYQGKEVRASLPSGLSLARYLYAGSMANALRQAGTVALFSYTESTANRCVEAVSIDSHSKTGIILKSPIQGALITAGVYLPERLKNVLQVRPEVAVQAQQSKISSYWAAGKNIFAEQGVFGILRGGFSRGLSITVLTAGANFMVDFGRGNLSRVQESD